ncbi:PilZ domain-containing protein [bacterium]|nr:PilZ domain-containing protein [bacterium]
MKNNVKESERRTNTRKVISMNAELIAGGQSYSGIIVNMSEQGLYMVTAESGQLIDIAPKSQVTLIAVLPNNEMVSMSCDIKWFQKKEMPAWFTFKLGLEILNPPSQYREFVSQLNYTVATNTE